MLMLGKTNVSPVMRRRHRRHTSEWLKIDPNNSLAKGGSSRWKWTGATTRCSTR